MKRNKRGMIFIAVGVTLLLVASGLYVKNIYEDKKAGEYASGLLNQLVAQEKRQIINKNENLPIIEIDGDAFIGKIVIDKLGTTLPVFDEWSYERLKKAPCRYSGSIATDNLIIAAHNYKSHFGDLKTLEKDDEIIFVDANGKKYKYAVKEITFLDGTAVTDMQSGKWDFTLFTCTKSGKQRVTVRCDKIS